MSTVRGLGVAHRLQASCLENTWSLHLGQIQSPGLSGSLPTNSLDGNVGTAAVNPASSGLSAPHRLQTIFLPNCRSPQTLQFQSPSLATCTLNGAGSTFGGLGVLHRLQLSCLAKTWSLHLEQTQSPGRIFAATASSSDLCVPHRRHVSFLANCKSPQLGQLQSPGLLLEPFSASPPLVAFTVAAAVVAAAVGSRRKAAAAAVNACRYKAA